MAQMTRVLKEKTEKRVSFEETRTPLGNFIVNGTARIKLWGGGSGTIQMNEIEIELENPEELTQEILYAELNDGGFGCEEIVSAIVDIQQEILVEREHLDEKGNPIQMGEQFIVLEKIYSDYRITKK